MAEIFFWPSSPSSRTMRSSAGMATVSSWMMMEALIYGVTDIAKLVAINPQEFDAIRRTALLAIDDMGKEPAEVLDYGNAYNPVIELMEYRYNEQLFTIISTNLTPKQVREKYGNRIADRFNEMMNVIAFTHETYRK